MSQDGLKNDKYYINNIISNINDNIYNMFVDIK